VLPAAGATLFDRRNAVEIELLHDGMWLESRNDDALVAGENLAMIGDELIQFGDAQALGPRRFRLSRLLRGRRGSEWAAATHAAGEAFVLMDADSLLALPMPVAQAGGVVEVAARGMGDGIAPALASRVVGTEAVRPPAPAHLTARRGSDGAIVIAWTRRSRTGWAWIDGVDAPLGEDREAYVVAVSGGTRVRVVEVDAPRFVYSAAMQAEDGAGASVTLDVAVTQAGSAAASRPTPGCAWWRSPAATPRASSCGYRAPGCAPTTARWSPPSGRWPCAGAGRRPRSTCRSTRPCR